ncbi:hypothetical protein HGRIS_014663 [Hohenbuehelia grisea]|uniref:MADS-box domain-containing protein n=1 Tax=Hohenbuehelia grisea TaxID=104357 RepID=A0ABR3JWD8_9AGAR
MGRRKIEIQPITHERNRSVTFLKRKNGLFKKAYELGVLCSVDVAVIIFEERPGHHLKLYQYCSTDINDIVQRHVRYDGEKDTRGPSDFSGNIVSKHDDIGDGDDDDGDDDEHQDVRHVGSKRRGDGKLKPEFGKQSGLGDMSMGVDPPIPMHPSHAHPSHSMVSHGSSSSHPISSDRHGLRGGNSGIMQHGHNPNKKPRIAPSVNTQGISNHSRSSSDDPHSGGASSLNGAFYQPSPTTNPNSFRHPSHPSHSGSMPNQYPPFFNMSTPPPFGGGFQEYPANSSARGPASPTSASSTFSNARFDQGRNVPSHLSRSHSAQGGAVGGVPGQRDLFSSFLDADEQSRASSNNPTFKFGGGGGLDWPVHTQASNQGPPPPGAQFDYLPPCSATLTSLNFSHPQHPIRLQLLPALAVRIPIRGWIFYPVAAYRQLVHP